jgi:dipeptidyl-peptidase-4
MKRHKIYLIFFILNYSFILCASELSINDIVEKRELLSPQKLKQLQWVAHTHNFSYIDKENSLIISDKRGAIKKVINLAQLNILLEASLVKFPTLSWLDNTRFWFIYQKNIYSYNYKSQVLDKINKIKAQAENIEAFSPQKIAFTVGPNIYVAINNSITQISFFSEDQHILNGHIVHREEFGINKGIFWSPDGNKIAYYRMDESMVEDYPFENFDTLPVTINYIKYPMAGRQSHHVSLMIYDIDKKTSTRINSGILDDYLTGVSWSPDSENIIINILSRGQNKITCNKYNINTGDLINTTFELATHNYINPLFSYYFYDNIHALWCSRHKGWFQLFSCDFDSKELKQCDFEARDIATCNGFNANKEEFFFTAYDKLALSRYGYLYSINDHAIQKLTPLDGTHTLLPSSDGSLILDIFSNNTTPYQVDLIDRKSNTNKNIYISPNPLHEYNIGNIRLHFLYSADNKDFLASRILYPPDFNPNHKYPALIYVYGGPGIQLVNNSWLYGARLWEIMMAQQGYIIFVLDNRGSAHRGLDFEQQSFGCLGKVEIEDQMQGVRCLQSMSYVDSERLGVFGWSFGGFMSLSLMLKKPHLFKAAVAGGAVVDWRYYEVMYTERYMKKPIDNPSGYEEANLLNYIHNLENKLLIISGTHDKVVLPIHTKLLTKKAIEYEKNIEQILYHNGDHHFDEKSDINMYKHITRFFEENLKEI